MASTRKQVTLILEASLSVLITCFHQGGLALEPASGDVLDLTKVLQTVSTDNLSGVRYTPGLDNQSSALLLQSTTRRLVLPTAIAERALTAMFDNWEVTFLASLRQDVNTSGTILAFSTETSRFLEIESCGQQQQLRFKYSNVGEMFVERFPYHLADGKWHKLALYRRRNSLTVFVDCHRISSTVLAWPDWTWQGGLNSPGARYRNVDGNGNGNLYFFLGQRSNQHGFFMGALQDVKIVTQAQGYQLQCPHSEPDYPTFAEFLALKQHYQLELSCIQYNDLLSMLEKAEQRINHLEQCECRRYCNDNGTYREEGQEWKQDQCTSCRCNDGEIECHRQQCPVLRCKHTEKLEGQCCPVCHGSCYHQGKHYKHGEVLFPRVCVKCWCTEGRIECREINKTESCPKLNCSKPIHIPDKCCPICNDLEFCSTANPCHSNATCVNTNVGSLCVCNEGFQGDGHTCEDIDECQKLGGRTGNHCGANTVCVNTIGNYKCECLSGYSHVDNFVCSGNGWLDLIRNFDIFDLF